jgi:TIR domain/PDZ domain
MRVAPFTLNRMADIFISYASDDRSRAKAVAEALERRGWSVWWDRKIPLGQSFDKVIEEAIAAARCIVVLWTRASVASDWVRSEASEGKRRGVLVPVFLEEVPAPLAFRLLNGADLSAWEAGTPHPELDTLTERIAEILEHRGTPERTVVGDDRRIGTHRARSRKPLLVAGVAVAVLLVLGAFYGAYIAGTWRRQSPANTPDRADRSTPTSSASPKSAPVGSTAADTTGLEDMLKTLGPGVGGSDGVTRVFELKDLGLHIIFIRPEQAEAFLGAGLSPGAVIWRVENGLGQAAGLQAGDVVAAINGQKISSEDELRRILRTLGPGKSRYVIHRDKKTLNVDIDCPTCTVS